ncbi:VOC family protein [Lentzea tibetensis]|uniref:VOC family protein n=1 Tax=Lentzea tibetensis TaxID=2591470 RepID=A0A563EKB3_9PSEU|nr:VOC family protein [Lentzea tibetensis]TWP47379.1 VOC family protein [Lentzea tibetensis]
MGSLGLVTLVVRDYDEAIGFYVDALGFTLVEDTPQGDKRWVVVAPASGASLLLARASDDAQLARVGDQTGGRVGFFLTTDDFDADYARMTAYGVRFLEAPRDEVYGRVVVFEDLYGNRWDLLGRAG